MQVVRLSKITMAGVYPVYCTRITKSAVFIINNESSISRYSRSTGRLAGIKLSVLQRVGEPFINLDEVSRFLKAIGKETWDGGVRLDKLSKVEFENRTATVTDLLVRNGVDLVDSNGVQYF